MKRFHGAVLTLLALYAAVAILQFFVGANSLYALLMAPLIVLRSVYWRVGINRLLFIILLAGIPIMLRRRTRDYIEQLLGQLRGWFGRRWTGTVRVWTHLPVWLRTFLGVGVVAAALAVTILSGVVLWVIAVLPFLAKTTVGLYLVRYLSNIAAARGVREIAPLLWRAVPGGLRKWIESHYRQLWWWTMRRIVKSRRRVTRRLRRPRPAAAPST